jgi:hypothetical protein
MDMRRSWDDSQIKPIAYRPFDHRYVMYSEEILERSRAEIMRHIIDRKNVSLSFNRGIEEDRPFTDTVVFGMAIQLHSLSIKEANNIAPLYLYPEEGTLETERRVNFDPKIYAEIRERAGLSKSSPSTCDGEGDRAQRGGGAPPSVAGATATSPSQVDGEDYPDELKVFDYIYGVLHSPDYRRTYAQFLKIDFPRIPYPASPEVFAHVAEKGGQLRRLHLMEDAIIGATPYPFSGAREDGDDNVVEKPAYVPLPQAGGVRGGSEPEASLETLPSQAHPQPRGASRTSPGDWSLHAPAGGEHGRVHINPDQYFDNVPALAWEFHIGGYQPAQKWLKDRKGRALSFDDVLHYQKIIKILTETDRIMKEIKLPL